MTKTLVYLGSSERHSAAVSSERERLRSVQMGNPQLEILNAETLVSLN